MKQYDVVSLTKELVSIPSDTGKDGELEVARFITSCLNDAGVAARFIEFAPKRANVVVEIGSGEGLMLNGHMDTVPVGDSSNWTYGVRPTIKNGKLYGRGTSDMKGGIAPMMIALSKINQKKTKRRLVAVFVAGEETGFEGTWNLLKNNRKLFRGVKYGIIGEPTDLRIQLAQKGATDMRVKFKGKAAHGSKPWLGDSAILKATRFIDSYTKLAQGFKVEDKLLGKGTVNIGKINGGTATNVVPDSCTVDIDRRIVPGETPAIAVQQVKATLRRLKIDANVELIFGRNAFKLDEKSKIVDIVKKALGTKPVLMGATGYTEAELYKAEAGIDSVVFGPGTKDIIHQANEYIVVSNLLKYGKIIEKITGNWMR